MYLTGNWELEFSDGNHKLSRVVLYYTICFYISRYTTQQQAHDNRNHKNRQPAQQQPAQPVCCMDNSFFVGSALMKPAPSQKFS